MNIVINGASLTGNKGASAMCITLINSLNRKYSNNINIALLSPKPELDAELASEFGIKIFPYRSVLRKSIPNALVKKLFRFRIIKDDTVLDAYEWASCIIDIHGINFSDSDHLTSTAIIPSAQIFLAKILKKPFIKFTQSFGPMKRISIRIFARLFLPMAKKLFPRESDAFNELKSLKLKNVDNHYVDSAFLLQPELPNDFNYIDNKKIRVAFIPNAILLSKSHNYKEACIRLLNNIIELNCHPVVVMHYSKPSTDTILLDASSNNDYKLINEIISECNNPSSIEAYTDEYTPSELKGIIGTCDISVPSRYHALVASVSQSLPSFCIGWAGKYQGLLSRVGLEDYAFSVDIKGNFDISNINESFIIFLENYKNNLLDISEKTKKLKENSIDSFNMLFKIIDEIK